MRKAKIKSVFALLIFLRAIPCGIYMAMYGVGKDSLGKASDIPLGLDLQGGLSVTYEITNESPSQEEIDATIDKLQRRVDAYSSEGEVYQEGDERITVEIPVDTEKHDAHGILEELGQPGQLLFLDETNYGLWVSGQAYVACVDGADVKNAEVLSNESSANEPTVIGTKINHQYSKTYEFENDFNEARFFSSLLDAPESAIFNAVDNLYSELDDETIQALQKGHSFIDPGSYESVIRERLDDLYCADKINYYVKWNNTVFTNCGATNEQELMTAQFYRLTTKDGKYTNAVYGFLAIMFKVQTLPYFVLSPLLFKSSTISCAFMPLA